jgi:flagellar hook-basal body complex protein FliE
MIQGVGQGGGGLAKAAIEAALKAQANSARAVEERIGSAFDTAPGGAVAPTDKSNFTDQLLEGLKAVDAGVKDVDRLPMDVATGKIDDFAELAGRLKQSELTFKFALEVRNKLIDAYRETMRMGV